jgi:3',5'-cyclic AMP phosphodiesterase CpdA
MSDRPKDLGYPTLASKFCEDLIHMETDGPVILCATGDFTQTAAAEEFGEAENFLKEIIATKYDKFIMSFQNTFIVPGNHDVLYEKGEVGLRFQQWTEFYNRIFDVSVRRENVIEMSKVHDRIDDLGVVVITLNSCIYTEKKTPDEGRGRIDVDQLAKIEKELENLDQDRLRHSIRICIIHHHPVLIPQLAEPGRGYDAVNNSARLLQLLKRFSFHAVLHGHKHNPFTFTDDIESTITRGEKHPIFFSCAGSLGSTELPWDEGISNCYNVIRIKFHPEGDQFRVRCETRRLTTHDETGYERLPPNWEWRTVKLYDKFFQSKMAITPRHHAVKKRSFSSEVDDEFEGRRIRAYEAARGYFPCVQVKPSLMHGQAYEAVCQIIQHIPKSSGIPSPPPIKVVDRKSVV